MLNFILQAIEEIISTVYEMNAESCFVIERADLTADCRWWESSRCVWLSNRELSKLKHCQNIRSGLLFTQVCWLHLFNKNLQIFRVVKVNWTNLFVIWVSWCLNVYSGWLVTRPLTNKNMQIKPVLFISTLTSVTYCYCKVIGRTES